MCIAFATVIFKAKSVFEFFMTFPLLLAWWFSAYRWPIIKGANNAGLEYHIV